MSQEATSGALLITAGIVEAIASSGVGLLACFVVFGSALFLGAMEAPLAVSLLFFVFTLSSPSLGALTAIIITSILAMVMSIWFQAGWLIGAMEVLFPRVSWRAWPRLSTRRTAQVRQVGLDCIRDRNDGEEETGRSKAKWGNRAPFPIDETGKPLLALTIDDVPATLGVVFDLRSRQLYCPPSLAHITASRPSSYSALRNSPLLSTSLSGKFGPSQIGACLHELDKVGARATLFVMSRELEAHGDAVRNELVKAVSRGFELGNHDVNDVKTVLRSREDFVEVTRECDDAIASIYKEAGVEWESWRAFGRERANSQEHDDGTDSAARYHDPLSLARVGQKPKWLRPGGGFWSNTILDEAEAAGYSTVLGNVFSWDVLAPAAHNVWFTRERARPGCIVILHDRPKLLATLRSLLPSLSQRYKIVTLSELFMRVAEAERDQ